MASGLLLDVRGQILTRVGQMWEIDILEYVGREPDIIFTSLHTQDSHGNTINTKKTRIEDIEEGYHIYAMDWSKK
jgi:beta-glucanase (GH16 family)